MGYVPVGKFFCASVNEQPDLRTASLCINMTVQTKNVPE